MTRTPEEIKKGLEELKFIANAGRIDDALALIQQLQDDNAEKDEKIRQLEAQNAELLTKVEQLQAEIEEYEEAANKCCYESKCNAELNHLEALCKRLKDENEQLQAERDAAVRDCGCFPCQTCEERENGDLCPMCEINGGYRKFHQWRGVQKEDSDA